MTRTKKLYITFGIAILLINGLHAFWFLSFTSLLWFIFFKLGLLIYFYLELIKEKLALKIPILAYRIILIISFFILLGIPKMNFGFLPFSGEYQIIERCIKEYESQEKIWKLDRIERSESNYGLYDSTQKIEMVFHLCFMFDWRFEIRKNEYKSEYNKCSFLGIGEPY